ncbi:hypothetical protein HPB50_020777 [Hyalomma asiaticum]|uniref:Uncharacterized protein n=1 Tax=Hyalomma asiaticum TaxID=266040 RepID=A0ACB7TN00_HYAAI|nr:hypothetical protein HPB50_020777 [Hyalomma asiaticum]
MSTRRQTPAMFVAADSAVPAAFDVGQSAEMRNPGGVITAAQRERTRKSDAVGMDGPAPATGQAPTPFEPIAP